MSACGRVRRQVDVQALNAQVEAKTRLKHQQKTEEQ
jgi:hypothetical protein